MDEFDRIFDGENMPLETIVDVIDHSRERRRFTGARGSGNQYESFVLFTELFEDRRHAQFFEAHDFRRDRSKNRAFTFALQKDIDTKSRDLAELRSEEHTSELQSPCKL